MSERILKATIVLAIAGMCGAMLDEGYYFLAIATGLLVIIGMILIHMELSRGTPESESK